MHLFVSKLSMLAFLPYQVLPSFLRKSSTNFIRSDVIFFSNPFKRFNVSVSTFDGSDPTSMAMSYASPVAQLQITITQLLKYDILNETVHACNCSGRYWEKTMNESLGLNTSCDRLHVNQQAPDLSS